METLELEPTVDSTKVPTWPRTLSLQDQESPLQSTQYTGYFPTIREKNTYTGTTAVGATLEEYQPFETPYKSDS